MRLGGELDGAEQAVQSPEILVFQPRGARIFVAGDGERMLGFGGIGGVAIAVSQRFRHIEFARRESVLAVTHERAVKPYVDRGGGTVDGEADRAVVFQRARKLRVERESTAVDRHMVVFRNIWRLRILVTVPRILDVDVLVLEIAGHLQVARHLDRAEIAILEIDGRERSAFHVHVARLFDTNLPFAVEALLRLARLADDISVAGMCRLAVRCEHRRIGEPACTCRGCMYDCEFGCICHLASPCITRCHCIVAVAPCDVARPFSNEFY